MEAMKELVLVDPFNAHEHCRDGGLRLAILPEICAIYSGCVAMPNVMDPMTGEPIMTGFDALRYRESIYRDSELSGMSREKFNVVPTIYLTPKTTPAMIFTAKAAGVPAGKAYPLSGTHNSAFGIADYSVMLDRFKAMAECKMKLLLHCEVPNPSVPPEQRERFFIPILDMIRDACPDLEIVVEHISDALMLDFVLKTPNMWATVGPQHLVLTREDADMSVHNLCMPIAKTKEDNERLIWEITHGDPERKLMNGTDSAAHWPKDKLTKKSPGVYSDPVTLQILAELFEREGATHRLQGFLSRGAEFYGAPPMGKKIRLIKQSWRVPYRYNGIVPLWAGREISWRIAPEDPVPATQ